MTSPRMTPQKEDEQVRPDRLRGECGTEEVPLPPVSEGYITPRLSWTREATPTRLTPAWAGEFNSFNDWVSFATKRLTGTHDPLMGAEIPSVCIDNIGRRCTMGGHFMRARDEGTFPVRYFWDCAPTPEPPTPLTAEAFPGGTPGISLDGHNG